MHQAQKPLVSSFFPPPQRRPAVFSRPSTNTSHSVCASAHTPLGPLVFLGICAPSHVFHHSSPSTSYTPSMPFRLYTCFHSYNAHWCHLSASNEPQHIKKHVFPPLELSDHAKLFTSAYLHISWPPEKCFYSQPQVIKSGWPFSSLSSMIVLLRWV